MARLGRWQTPTRGNMKSAIRSSNLEIWPFTLTASGREPLIQWQSRSLGLDELAVGFEKPARWLAALNKAASATMAGPGRWQAFDQKRLRLSPRLRGIAKKRLGLRLKLYGAPKTAQQVSKSGSGCAPNYVGHQKRLRSPHPKLRGLPGSRKQRVLPNTILGRKP